MSDVDRERSKIANNRLAAAIVAGSLLVCGAVAGLYWTGYLAVLVPSRGPTAASLPLYLLLALVTVVLVAWGWQRFVSLLE